MCTYLLEQILEVRSVQLTIPFFLFDNRKTNRIVNEGERGGGGWAGEVPFLLHSTHPIPLPTWSKKVLHVRL